MIIIIVVSHHTLYSIHGKMTDTFFKSMYYGLITPMTEN